jgi:hypothetical protein
LAARARGIVSADDMHPDVSGIQTVWIQGRRLCVRNRERPLPKSDPEREEIMETDEQSAYLTSRRSFLIKGAAVGAVTLGAGRLLTDASPASASGGLTKGDAAILRFLAAAEIIETDIWQ